MSDRTPGWDPVLEQLSSGRVLAHPTETVYGLAARVDEVGVQALRRLKSRGPDRPFLMLLPEGDDFEVWRDRFRWTAAARRIADQYWPGPVTLVLEALDERLPEGVRNRHGGVAVRRSPHPFVRDLMARWKAPLLSTSANRAGEPSPHAPAVVRRAFESEIRSGQVLLMDEGELPPRNPSTLVDCTGVEPRVIREGDVPRAHVVRPDTAHLERR